MRLLNYTAKLVNRMYDILALAERANYRGAEPASDLWLVLALSVYSGKASAA